VVAVSSILAGFSQSFLELMVLRGSGGVGSAMFSISAQALLLGTVPRSQRGRASGLFSGGVLLGGISGPGQLEGWWDGRGRCGRRSSSTGCLLGCARDSLAAVVLRRVPDRRLVPTRPARPIAGHAGPRGPQPHLAGRRVGQPGRRLLAALGVRGAPVCRLFVREILHRSSGLDGIGFLLFAALKRRLPCCRGGRVADTLGRRPVIIAGCVVSRPSAIVDAGGAVRPVGYLAALAVAGFGSGLLDVAPARE